MSRACTRVRQIGFVGEHNGGYTIHEILYVWHTRHDHADHHRPPSGILVKLWLIFATNSRCPFLFHTNLEELYQAVAEKLFAPCHCFSEKKLKYDDKF